MMMGLSMRSRRLETILTYLVAGAAGASLWVSAGAMAVIQPDTRVRVVALPPLWMLAVAVVIPLIAVRALKPSLVRLSPLLATGLLWLPFMPGAVPPAFLIWHGPIRLGVWVIAAVGVSWATVGQRDEWPALTNSSRAPWIAAVLAAVLYASGAALLRAQLPLGDEPHYLMMTQSLIKDGDLRIENNHKNRDYASFSEIAIEPHYLTRGTDGQIYSSHPPGVSVLVVPGFSVAGYYGAVGTVIACVSLASALAWHGAWLLTGTAGSAWLAWASIFITAPVYLHAITVFPDAAATLPIMAVLWFLIAFERGRAHGPSTVVAVSIAVAVLPWLHSRFAIAAVGLGLAVAFRLVRRSTRMTGLFLIAPIASAGLWLGFFWLIWGTPSPTAPWGAGLATSLEWIPRGVKGLIFDQQAGLLPSAPAYVCAAAGAVVLLKRFPRLLAETALVSGAVMLTAASYETWWGGHGGPARYLVAILPLAVPAVAVLAAPAESWGRQAALVLLGVSQLLLFSKITSDSGAHAYFPEGGLNPLLQWMSTSVDLTAALPALVVARDAHFEATDPPSSIWIITIWLMAAVAASALCRSVAAFRSYRFAVTVLAAASVVMVAASGVWWAKGISSLTPSDSARAFIDTWQPDRQPLAIQWRPPYLTSPETLARRIEIDVPLNESVTMPAGEYEVLVQQRTPAIGGTLSATVGDSSLPLTQWAIAATDSGPLAIRFPIRTPGVRFQAAGFNSVDGVRLRLAAPPPSRRPDGQAIRAAAFGDVRVFFLDRRAYAEPAGFWVPAGAPARVIVDRADQTKTYSCDYALGLCPRRSTWTLTACANRSR